MKKALGILSVLICLSSVLLASCEGPHLSDAIENSFHGFANAMVNAAQYRVGAEPSSMLDAPQAFAPADVPLAAAQTPQPETAPTETVKPFVTPEPTPTPPPLPKKYTMEWAERYVPGSVAPFEEQVGDNGDYEDIATRPAPDTYQLVVDYHNQCVRAYKRNDHGAYELERLMICTTGGNGDWTPTGLYHLQEDYHRFGFFTNFNCYAQYWTQMQGSFYFHSILYTARSGSTYTMSSYNQLGRPGSHGCIRLLVPDARWIYENCAPGTQCTVTTEFKENPALRAVLKKGLKGCIDYTEPPEQSAT